VERFHVCRTVVRDEDVPDTEASVTPPPPRKGSGKGKEKIIDEETPSQQHKDKGTKGGKGKRSVRMLPQQDDGPNPDWTSGFY